MDYKYKQLPEISGYFAESIWDLTKHDFYIEERKDKREKEGSKIFFDASIHPYIPQELQMSCENILNNKKISWNYALALSRSVRYLNEYLNQKPELTSILDLSKEIIVEEFPVFLEKEKGIKPYIKAKFHHTNHGLKKENVQHKIPEFAYILRIYDTIYEYNYLNDLPLMEKDIWHLNDLGFKARASSAHCPRNTLNFSKIKQPKIKLVVKKYVRGRLINGVSPSTIRNDIKACVIFSDFLAEHYPDLDSLALLTRDHVEHFFVFLANLKIVEYSKDKTKGKIRLFLTDITRKKWPDAPPTLLISKWEILANNVQQPKIFSDEEIMILKKYSHLLPDIIRRMFGVLLGVGMRVGDACILKVTDIKKGADGIYDLKYWQQKTRNFNTCDLRLAEMDETRKALEESIRDNNGSDYIFPSSASKDKPFHINTFVYYMKMLIINNDIRINGELIAFKTHKCRKTKVTNDIRSGKSYEDAAASIGLKDSTNIKHYAAKPTDAELKDSLAQLFAIDNRIIGDILEKNKGLE